MTQGSKKEKRQKLFNKLSTNLSYYAPENKASNQFACPFCLHLFSSIDGLSDAHIFPQALQRGSSITLACEQCNNTVGSKIESQEANRFKFENALLSNGKEPLRAYLKPDVDGLEEAGRVSADIKVIRGKERLEVIVRPLEEKSNPESLRSMTHNWGKSGFSINVEFRKTGNWDRGKLTYLQSAYLFLFSQLGYEWVFHPFAESIREQIFFPDKNLLNFAPLTASNCDEIRKSTSKKPEISWYLVSEPHESRGYLIVFPPLRNEGKPLATWMPIYDCCKKFPSNSLNFSCIKRLPIHTEDHLAKFEYRYRSFHIRRIEFKEEQNRH